MGSNPLLSRGASRINLVFIPYVDDQEALDTRLFGILLNCKANS